MTNERGLIDLDRLPDSMTDQEKVVFAIQEYRKCKGNEVKGLTFTKPKVLTDTIYLPSYFVFESNHAAGVYNQTPGISVQINDPEKEAIVLVDRNGGNEYQPQGHIFRNVFIENHAPLKRILNTSNCALLVMDNVRLGARSGPMENALLIGSDQHQPPAVYTKIINCRIAGGSDAAIRYLKAGSQHSIQGSTIVHGRVGITGECETLFISDTGIEDNESGAIDLTNSRLKIDFCHFENADMRLTDCRHVTMTHTMYSGEPIALNYSGPGSVVLTSNNFHKEPVRYEGTTQPGIEMKNNWFVRKRFFNAFQGSYRGDPVNVQGNFGDGWQQ